MLAIGRIVLPLQRQLYRRTGGRLSLTGRAPVLLLTTAGRRTGKARTVPLLYIRDGDRLVICNVNPGFERPNPWVVNLRAQPHAEVRVGRGTTSMSARPASDDELVRYWPQLTKVWPAYQAFYDKGGKRSVFVLEPDGYRRHPRCDEAMRRATADRDPGLPPAFPGDPPNLGRPVMRAMLRMWNRHLSADTSRMARGAQGKRAGFDPDLDSPAHGLPARRGLPGRASGARTVEHGDDRADQSLHPNLS